VQQSQPDAAFPQISIIVPTRNEAENISPLLERLSETVHNLHVEVLFVDDSTDDTVEMVTSLQCQHPFPIRLIARPPEQRNGLSGAVVDGLSSALGKWVCVMDADLQHPPETIPRMWEQARKTGADMVVGSRRGDLVGPLGLTKMRSLTSKGLTILARMLFPRLLRNVSDPLTGLFLVKRSKVDVGVLRPDGFKILLEILVRCPDLHVTEIHFDFAPRQEGQSKADVREGMRFFRHVVRLRVTVNPHLIRFLIVVIVGILGNGLLLWALVEGLSISVLLASMLAVEALALWITLLFEKWVFRERKIQRSERSFWESFLLVQIVLAVIYLPLMLFLTLVVSTHYFLANTMALAVIGLLLYGLSEQWIWTKGGMVWQPQSYFYRIHDILSIESQVQLAELQHFATTALLEDIDIQIRLDRQGTPSPLPGGISYDERLGRFGFGLTVLPGDFLQIVVSPLLERSPSFLFTNIVEPVLRWRLVPKGFALVKAAGVTSGESAVLIHGEYDLGHTMSILSTQYGYAFMADDLTIVDRDGMVYGYPKPVTINQRMTRDSERQPNFRDRLSQSGQQLLYSRFARRIGLWLSDRDLPAATLNTYLQWLVPQPKDMLAEVFSGIEYGEPSECASIVNVSEKPAEEGEDLVEKMIDALQQGKESAGFQPHPLLAEQLRHWHGIDLLREERAIIKQVVEASVLHWFDLGGSDWWFELANRVFDNDPSNGQVVALTSSSHNTLMFPDVQGEPKPS
jgi:glycosyltransferase involved in cell wall biosynthesis